VVWRSHASDRELLPSKTCRATANSPDPAIAPSKSILLFHRRPDSFQPHEGSESQAEATINLPTYQAHNG
jgi:hypothetical protein